ncbi:MAG: endolytic transglycosylase MltG [Anaerolineales bacterium]|nr:endolytic transglycosylase MltG [Anaerolineales bacterium]
MKHLTTFLPKWAWLVVGFSFVGAILLVFVGLHYIQNDEDIAGLPLILDSTPIQPLQIEVGLLSTLTSTPTNTPLPATITPTPSFTSTNTPHPTQEPITAVAEIIASPTAAACAHPDGWEAYQVVDGDTLFAFQLGAGRAGNPATVDEILAANCLGTTFLQVGQILWLPPGAAENAPSSDPIAPDYPAGAPRTPNCPCTITVRTGWRLGQIADEVNRTDVSFSGADFLAAARTIPARDFLASVPVSAGLEGFMLPGTYTLQNSTTAAEFRDMMLDAFAASASGLIANAATQGITPYEAVMMASIVQKEAGDPHEQTLVASVFYNRMRSGKTLGASVTLMYAYGGVGDWWPSLPQGASGSDSPYNTFRFLGFPPTAISNPSLTALQAAINPAQTNYYYFTGNCNGPGNLYAETYEQHLENVRLCG